MAALLGIFFPTSILGEISSTLSFIAYIGPGLFLLISLKLNRWQLNRAAYLLLLIVIILFFTIISPFSYVAWGGLAPYFLTFLLLLTDFRWVRNIKYFWIDRMLLWIVFSINFIIIIIGFGLVVDDSSATGLIQKYYQSINNDLYEEMIVWYSKPVTFFGSHSTAAFAYFSLFVLNLKLALSVELNRVLRSFFLTSAIGFSILNIFLLSNTSAMMAIGMGVVFIVSANKIMSAGARFIFFTLLVVGIVVFVIDLNIIQLILGDSKDNGFMARYTSGGRLQGTYDYLLGNYFVPIGISYSPAISLGDNFIAEYIIKISIIGYLIIMYLLWTWFRRHLNFYHSILFFGFFVLSDFAYPLLVYSRVAAVIPFYVLLWCRLESSYFLKQNLRTESKFIHGSPLIANS